MLVRGAAEIATNSDTFNSNITTHGIVCAVDLATSS